MNADYRAGMMAALKVIDRRTDCSRDSEPPQNAYQDGWLAAMRECRNIANALHDAARTWDCPETKEEEGK